MKAYRSIRWLIAVLGTALVLRVGWVLSRSAELDPRLGDQTEYLGFARNLLNTGQYKYFDPRFGHEVYAWRPPGYPLFLAALGANLRLVQLAQTIVDTSTVLAVFLLGRRLLGERRGLVAAGMTAVNPFLIYFTGLALSETLYISLLAWGLTLCWDGSWRRATPGCILLATSVLVRPSGIVLAFLLPMIGSRAPWWKGLLLGTGAIVLLLGPWMVRNRLHPGLHAWIWSTTNGGITAYDGFHPGATGASSQEFMEQIVPGLKDCSEVERDRWFSEQARQWMWEHPGQSLRLVLVKILRTWSPIPLSSEYGGNRLYVSAGLLYSVPFDLLVLIGLFGAWRPGGIRGPSTGLEGARSGFAPVSAKVFLILPAIYFTAIHALSVGSLRYRLPAEPPMTILAAAALVALLYRMLHGPSQRNT